MDEDNLKIELINKDKAINALIPIMCKHSIEPDIQDEIILCLLNIQADTEIKEIIYKIIHTLEHDLEYIEYDRLQRGDENVDAFCDGFRCAIKCIKEYVK